MHIYNKLLFTLFVGIIMGCTSGDKPKESSVDSQKQTEADSVIVDIQAEDFSATFHEIAQEGRGSAEGEAIFQRYGNIEYVLDELYSDRPIVLKNNPHADKSYKVMVRWSADGSFTAARDSLFKQLELKLGYTTETEIIQKVNWLLSVDDESILSEQVVAETKINFKSEAKNNQWDITATLPRLTEELSKRMNTDVNTDVTDKQLYNFKLDMQGGVEAVARQLDKYGLAMESREVSVEQIKINFR